MKHVSAQAIEDLIRLVEANPDFFASGVKGCDPVELAVLKLQDLIQADIFKQTGVTEIAERAAVERVPLESELEQ